MAGSLSRESSVCCHQAAHVVMVLTIASVFVPPLPLSQGIQLAWVLVSEKMPKLITQTWFRFLSDSGLFGRIWKQNLPAESQGMIKVCVCQVRKVVGLQLLFTEAAGSITCWKLDSSKFSVHGYETLLCVPSLYTWISKVISNRIISPLTLSPWIQDWGLFTIVHRTEMNHTWSHQSHARGVGSNRYNQLNSISKM